MGLFGLFAPTAKVATSDSLLILEERHKTKYTPVVDLHDFYLSILESDPSRYLIISASLNGRIIPIIDCDSIAEHNEAREYLRKREMRHAVFQSSAHPHYWIIPDMTFAAFPMAWRAFCYVPGADHKYLKFTKDRNFFCVRGELKQPNDPPKLIHTSCSDSNVTRFLELLVEHFAHERMRAIALIKSKRQQEEKKNKKSTTVSGNWY